MRSTPGRARRSDGAPRPRCSTSTWPPRADRAPHQRHALASTAPATAAGAPVAIAATARPPGEPPRRQPRAPVTPPSVRSGYGSLTDNRVLRRTLEPGLTAAVGMVHELHVGAARTRRDRHPERVADQRGAHMRRELPADH